VILSVGYVNNSFAAAFQLIEQSGKGAGNAHAGEAAPPQLYFSILLE